MDLISEFGSSESWPASAVCVVNEEASLADEVVVVIGE